VERPPKCGDANWECCPGNSCNNGLVCEHDMCVEPPAKCGDPLWPCCPGGWCNDGYYCEQAWNVCKVVYGKGGKDKGSGKGKGGKWGKWGDD
jgi:hypothetical protein